MYFKFTFLFLFLEFALVFCKNAENITSVPENYTSSGISTRKTRDTYNFVYADLIGCAVQSDPSCLVNVAENFLAVKKNELLAQADQEVMRATGRADPDNSPSTLSKTVEKLISDLTGLFKNGISRFFRDSDDDEDDLSEDQNSTDEDHNENKNRDIGEEEPEGRKKKKKKLFGKRKKSKKMKHMMKFVAVAIVVVTKLSLLFKILHSHFQMKFFGVAAMGLAMQLLKFWLDIKNGYSPPRVVHYDTANRPNDLNGLDFHWARQYEDNRQNFPHTEQRPRDDYNNWNSYNDNNYNFNQRHDFFPN